MNEFVDECRREWRRLRVPERDADDMAAELAGDLDEGASPEDVLGADAVDACSFARSWAAERGLIRARRFGRIAVPVSVLAFVAVTIAGAALLIVASPSDSARLAVEAPPRVVELGPQRVWVGPPDRVVTLSASKVRAAAERAAARARAAIQATSPPLVRLGSANDSDADRTIGLILLIVGLAGVVPAALFWSGRIALGR